MNDLLTRVGAMKGCGEEPSRQDRAGWREHHVHVALDGKTLRGTLGHEPADQPKMHQLALYETQTGVILKEQVTGEKQNELSIVSQFLTPLLVKGRIISADALHTQRAFCFQVTRWDGDYLLIAKDNQASLADDLRLFFTQPPHDCRDWRTARTVNKGHGRLEIRDLVASSELNEFLGRQWAGVAQVFGLTGTVSEKGQMRQEVVYGITSLSPSQARADRLLELVRQHWTIEAEFRREKHKSPIVPLCSCSDGQVCYTADERARRSPEDTVISSVNSARMRTVTGGSLGMNVRTRGPQILLFERNQHVLTLLTNELQQAGYECYAARTAVEVFATMTQQHVHLVLVNLAQPAAGRGEFWVALEAQRRGRGVQVLTYRCTNLAGYGAADPEERGRGAQADLEVDGMLGVLNLVDAVRARLPAATTGSPAQVGWAEASSEPSGGGQPSAGADEAAMAAPWRAEASSRPSREAVPLPAVAPTSALAALASAFLPARQQSTTTAQAEPQPAESLATHKDTDRVRAIIYPSQLAWHPPVSRSGNAPGAASALQPTSSASGEETGLEQLARLVRMQGAEASSRPFPQREVLPEVRPEPHERAVSPPGQAGGEVLALVSATRSGLPVAEAGKTGVEEGKSALACERTPSVKGAVPRTLSMLFPRWVPSAAISQLGVKIGLTSRDKVEHPPQGAARKDHSPLKEEQAAPPREETAGSAANQQVWPRYLLALTIANTILLLVLLLIVATRLLSP